MSAARGAASSCMRDRAAAGTSARPRRARLATARPTRAAPRTARRTRAQAGAAAVGAGERRAGLRPGRRRRPAPRAAGRARRADTRDELQRAQSGALAVRVGGEAQHREHVLDVRRVEELQAAVLDERDVAPRQLELERVAVLAAAKEHRLALQREPRLAQREDALGDPRRFRRLVLDPDQRRPLGRAARRSRVPWRDAPPPAR